MNTKFLLSLCAAMAAMANPITQTRTKVPFSFEAGGKMLPPGEYTLIRGSDSILEVRNDRGDAALTIITNPVGPVTGHAQPKLVFVKKHGQYHLSEVHLGPGPGGNQIPVK